MKNYLETNQEFTRRHIGPGLKDQQSMLKELGFNSLDEMISKVIPKTIFNTDSMSIGPGQSEHSILNTLKIFPIPALYSQYPSVGAT